MGKGRKLGGEPAGREVKGGDRGRHRASPSGGEHGAARRDKQQAKSESAGRVVAADE